MPINFSNGRVLSEVSGRISAPGRIVQVVHSIHTGSAGTASTSPVDFFTSSPITLTAPNNRVIIELHSEGRQDQGAYAQNNWCLYYMDIIHVNTGAQLSYSGYIGEQNSSITHVHRSTSHVPGNIGPHTYRARFWAYGGNTVNVGNGVADNDSIAYLRIWEVAV